MSEKKVGNSDKRKSEIDDNKREESPKRIKTSVKATKNDQTVDNNFSSYILKILGKEKNRNGIYWSNMIEKVVKSSHKDKDQVINWINKV